MAYGVWRMAHGAWRRVWRMACMVLDTRSVAYGCLFNFSPSMAISQFTLNWFREGLSRSYEQSLPSRRSMQRFGLVILLRQWPRDGNLVEPVKLQLEYQTSKMTNCNRAKTGYIEGLLIWSVINVPASPLLHGTI